MHTSKSTNSVGVSRPRARMRPSTNMTATASTRPTSTPPKKSRKKVAVASESEKAPPTATAMANSKQTTPEASLKRASPESRDFCLSVSVTSAPMAATAAASVGPSAAPRASAAASGMDGMTAWSARPTTSVVTTTRPTASEVTGAQLRSSASLLAWRDSSKRRGAIKSTRKSSGSPSTSVGSWVTRVPTTVPSAICASGSETRGRTWPKTLDASIQPSSRRMISKEAMHFSPCEVLG